jgi:hypothetical protein
LSSSSTGSIDPWIGRSMIRSSIISSAVVAGRSVAAGSVCLLSAAVCLKGNST